MGDIPQSELKRGLFRAKMEAALEADDYHRVHRLLSRIDPSTRVYRTGDGAIEDDKIGLSKPHHLIDVAAGMGAYHVVKGLLEGYYTEPATDDDDAEASSRTDAKDSSGISTEDAPSDIDNIDKRFVPPGRRPAQRRRPLPSHNTLYHAIHTTCSSEARSLLILRLLHAYEPDYFHTSFCTSTQRSGGGITINSAPTDILNIAISAARLGTVRWLIDRIGVTPTPWALSLAVDVEGEVGLEILTHLTAAHPALLTTRIPLTPTPRSFTTATDDDRATVTTTDRAAFPRPPTADLLALAALSRRPDIVAWLLPRLPRASVPASRYAHVRTASWLASGLLPADACKGDGLGPFHRGIAKALVDAGAEVGDGVRELVAMGEGEWARWKVRRREAARGNEERERGERVETGRASGRGRGTARRRGVSAWWGGGAEEDDGGRARGPITHWVGKMGRDRGWGSEEELDMAAGVRAVRRAGDGDE